MTIPLSKREKDILKRVAFRDGEIACELSISLPTTREYLKRINNKLDATNRTMALVRGLKLGIIDVDDLRC